MQGGFQSLEMNGNAAGECDSSVLHRRGFTGFRLLRIKFSVRKLVIAWFHLKPDIDLLLKRQILPTGSRNLFQAKNPNSVKPGWDYPEIPEYCYTGLFSPAVIELRFQILFSHSFFLFYVMLLSAYL